MEGQIQLLNEEPHSSRGQYFILVYFIILIWPQNLVHYSVNWQSSHWTKL